MEPTHSYIHDEEPAETTVAPAADDLESPFEEEVDTTTRPQRRNYFALCWLIADKNRPTRAGDMRRRIHELNDELGPRRRFPRDSWEKHLIRKLTKLLEDLRQA